MLSGLFNYDNPIWRFIGKFWDILIVNLLWAVCCIPVVTIGASTTALYYVTLRLVRDEDGYTIRSFFKSFKENFKQATIIWLIFLVIGVILGFDLYFVLAAMEQSTLRTVGTAVFLAMLFIWLAMFTFVFPLQCRFYNPVKRTIFNAFFMSIRHIFHTIGMIAIDVGLVVLTFTLIPQLMLFGFALIAFVNSYFLNAVFNKYIPKGDREDDQEMRPLFADEEEEGESNYFVQARQEKEGEDAAADMLSPEPASPEPSAAVSQEESQEAELKQEMKSEESSEG